MSLAPKTNSKQNGGGRNLSEPFTLFCSQILMILQVDQKIHFLCAFYSVVHNKMGKWWAEERITRVAIFMIYLCHPIWLAKRLIKQNNSDITFMVTINFGPLYCVCNYEIWGGHGMILNIYIMQSFHIFPEQSTVKSILTAPQFQKKS